MQGGRKGTIMTITETPRRARATVRLSGSGLVARFFEPWFFRPRRFSGRMQLSSKPSEKWPEPNAAPVHIKAGHPGSNAPLGSLAGGNLASRFHAWWGASGRRYVCSVFHVESSEVDFGLPDFAEAIVLAVASDADGHRRLLSLGHFEAATEAAARQQFVAAAIAAGATEWHIHLMTVDDEERRAVARDLESCCLEP
jgi:hypothetical protein